MNKKIFYTVVILLSFLAVGIQPVFAVINIPEDESVGTWDEDNKIYILTSDVSDTIILSNPLWIGEGPRITFDGDGHTISAPIDPPVNYYGISFDQINTSKNGYITIQNLNVTGCDVGINIQTATRINVIDTNISLCDYGINIGNAGTCIISDNTISDCSEYGIELNHGINNTIYNNNFLNRAGFQAHVFGGSSGNVFELNGSGNFWSDYTGLDEVEPFGIGDTPYTFTGGQDNFPLVPPPQTLQEVIENIILVIEQKVVPEDAEKEMVKAVKELKKAIKEFEKGKIDKTIKKIAKAVKRLEKAHEKGAETQDVIDMLDALIQEL